MLRHILLATIVNVALFGRAPSVAALPAKLSCPEVPAWGPIRDSSIFNPVSTTAVNGQIAVSWLVLRQATVHAFHYLGGVGSPAPCELPTEPLEFNDGRSYDPECYQCVAVTADFADMAARSHAGEGVTNYDHPLELNFSTPIDGDDGPPRWMRISPTIRVKVQQRQVAQLPRYVRWDEDDRVLRINLESYYPDTLNPEEGATGTVRFTISWPPHIVASRFRVLQPPERMNVTNAGIVWGCESTPVSENCTMSFQMKLKAPYNRYNFTGTYKLGFKLDCRLPSCPDFESGREHEIDLSLWTDSWAPHDPYPGFGLTNTLLSYKDPDHTIPVHEAFSWGRDAFFVYSAFSVFSITGTRLEFINISHSYMPSVYGCIWDGVRVNDSLIHPDHLTVTCPTPGGAIPTNQCRFRLKFDRGDPLWRDALSEPYFRFNMHVGGIVSYKKDGTDRITALLSGTSLFADTGVYSGDDNVPEQGDVREGASRPYGLGEEPSDAQEYTPVFYAGVGLISMSAILLAVAFRISKKAHDDLQPERQPLRAGLSTVPAA